MSSAKDNFQITIIGFAALIVVAAILWFGIGRPDPAPTTVPSTWIDAPDTQAEGLAVHVSGAVLSPGLAVLPAGARVADAIEAAGGAASDADLSLTNLAAPLHDGDHIVVASFDSTRTLAGSGTEGLDLNTATTAELETLPGVGPVLAARIVAFREEWGRFDQIEDLLDVPGIGEAKLSQMRDAIAAP